MSGRVRNYGLPCAVRKCGRARLRHPELCPIHHYRLRTWGSVRADLPIGYKKHPPGTVNGLTYRTWAMMRNRTTNPRAMDWKYYGGRGITLCKQWYDFRNFLADMGERPSRALTIDRINNAKGYSPANCRWATKKQQRQNQRPRK